MTDGIRSPLARARGLGSAKDGTHHWIMQRVTAIALIPLSLYLLSQLGAMTTDNYTLFIDWLKTPVNAIAVMLFVVASFYHAVLGLQVIVEDYIHHELFKTVKIWGIKVFYFFAGFAACYAVIAANFGL